MTSEDLDDVLNIVAFVVLIWLSWLVFNDAIGHALLCDTPSSKVCR